MRVRKKGRTIRKRRMKFKELKFLGELWMDVYLDNKMEQKENIRRSSGKKS